MFAWWWLPTALAQSTLQVPAEYPTLQLAVLAAQPGDSIEVDAASYTRGSDEDVVVAMPLTIEGVGGMPLMPRLVVVQGDLVVKNVRLRGVSREVVDLGRDAAAVVMGGSLALYDSTLSTTVAGSVGVVGLGGDVWLERTTATDFWPEPVVEMYGGRLDVADATFLYDGGGAIVGYDTDVTVTRSTFQWNWALAGGDIKVTGAVGGSLTVTESTFDYSTADWGAAIYTEGVDVVLTDATFTHGIAWEMGGAVQVGGAPMGPVSLTVTDSWFEGGYAMSGAALVVGGVEGATVERTTFVGNTAQAAGALALNGGDLTVRDATFDGNSATWGDGGTIAVVTDAYNFLGDSTLILEDTEVAGPVGTNGAASGGCLAAGLGSTVEIRGGSLHDCRAALAGGAISFGGTALTLTGTRLDANQAPWGGAIYQAGGALTLDGVVAEGNHGNSGAVAQAWSASVQVTDSLFQGNGSDANVFEALDSVGLTMARNRWCANQGGAGAAIVAITGADGGPFEIHNDVFLFNAADVGTNLYYGPSDWLLNQGPDLWVLNNDFAGNDVAAAATVRGRVDFRNNVVADQPLGVVLEAAANNLLAGDYNLWFATDPSQGNEGQFPNANDLVDVDPLVQGYVEGDCASNLWLRPESPARDAGDPGIVDPDGSRSDIGAFGGPDADLSDADGDGWFEDLDCDDLAPGSHPGAAEKPYDGVDDDCDGVDLCDVDGDGRDAAPCGGDDCDDDDPKSFPGATDPPDDGVDQDCDDFQPRTWVNGGGGCDHGRGGPGLGLGVALAALAGRRRLSARR